MDSQDRIKLIQELREVLKPLNIAHEAAWMVDEALCVFSKSASQNEIQEQLKEYVRRRQKHEPLAYIFGHWSFRRYEMDVGPGVLIPRPETEELVEVALTALENSFQNAERLFNGPGLKIADLGAGTGCIGLSFVADLIEDLRTEGFPGDEYSRKLSLELVEKSPEAYVYTKRNTQKMSPFTLNANVQALNLSWQDWASEESRCDFIFSNPPYVTEEEWRQCDVGVRGFEPKAALVPMNIQEQPNAVGSYIEILSIADRILNPGGWLWFELGTIQPDWILDFARTKTQLTDLRVLKDMAKKPRFFCARKSYS